MEENIVKSRIYAGILEGNIDEGIQTEYLSLGLLDFSDLQKIKSIRQQLSASQSLDTLLDLSGIGFAPVDKTRYNSPDYLEQRLKDKADFILDCLTYGKIGFEDKYVKTCTQYGLLKQKDIDAAKELNASLTVTK